MSILPFGCGIQLHMNGGIFLMKRYNDMIRELRQDRDFTQKDIAEILGTNQKVYSRYELGIRALPIEHLIKLCKFYNVSADYILCLKNGK